MAEPRTPPRPPPRPPAIRYQCNRCLMFFTFDAQPDDPHDPAICPGCGSLLFQEENNSLVYAMFLGVGEPIFSNSMLRSLQEVVVTEEEVEVECPVCKEHVRAGETMRRTPCNHVFHAECILTWLGYRNTCPVCRFELSTDDAD
ncbi:E3 ubiquitin-protein ligase RING1-like [Acorus gramineus]|uniref:E3 ubiquitin-protein ligase RING1-like n=1 Tax=Acorus gramineus TaxID=55184 RepID=A0AAV9BB85_ACOGR|nr:E3 ubiquitin-protein ligase RING1-like [Acorus gramineus]